MGNHGGCGLAGHHGRLAAARRGTRHRAGICNWRRGAAADRVGLWQAGGRHARRGGRDCVHVGSVSSIDQLCYGLDDDARVLHRVPVGGRGRGPDRGIHHAGTRFGRTLPHRGTPGLLAASSDRPGLDRSAHRVELSRHSFERDVSELDELWNARPVCHLRIARSEPRVSSEFSAAVYAHAAGIDSASDPDCAVFYDGI